MGKQKKRKNVVNFEEEKSYYLIVIKILKQSNYYLLF